MEPISPELVLVDPDLRRSLAARPEAVARVATVEAAPSLRSPNRRRESRWPVVIALLAVPAAVLLQDDRPAERPTAARASPAAEVGTPKRRAPTAEANSHAPTPLPSQARKPVARRAATKAPPVAPPEPRTAKRPAATPPPALRAPPAQPATKPVARPARPATPVPTPARGRQAAGAAANVLGVVVTARDGEVALAWQPPPGSDHILIRRSPGAGAAYESSVYSGAARAYVDRALQNGVTYRYVIVNYARDGGVSTGVPTLVTPEKLR